MFPQETSNHLLGVSTGKIVHNFVSLYSTELAVVVGEKFTKIFQQKISLSACMKFDSMRFISAPF